jgi:hypothetical protein
MKKKIPTKSLISTKVDHGKIEQLLWDDNYEAVGEHLVAIGAKGNDVEEILDNDQGYTYYPDQIREMENWVRIILFHKKNG